MQVAEKLGDLEAGLEAALEALEVGGRLVVISFHSPALYRTFLKAATRLRALTPSKVGPWTQNHSAPKPAARSLHDMAREHLAKKSGETR